jgi:hypothetical protein
MRTKAGIACLAIAAFALAALAATGLGARFTGLTTVSRPHAITLHAQVADSAAAKRAKKPPTVLYASTKPTALDIGTQSVALTGCPTGTHIIDASVGALHPNQAHYLTVNGQGLLANKAGKVIAGFTDVTNDSDTVSPPGFAVKAVGSIVCVRGKSSP